MEIRRLGPHEMSRFRTIRLRALRDAPVAFGTTFDVASAWSTERWETLFSSLLAFVAVTEDGDVGMVRAAPDPEVEGAARLGSLWVAPEVRGQGIGSLLVGTVLEWAHSQGFGDVLLDVTDDNAAAVAFYEALGFAPTGRSTHLPPPREHLRKHQRRLKLQGLHRDPHGSALR